jgi:hypothetical protein
MIFYKGKKKSNYFFNESTLRFKASKIYSIDIVYEEEPSGRADENRQKTG